MTTEPMTISFVRSITGTQLIAVVMRTLEPMWRDKCPTTLAYERSYEFGHKVTAFRIGQRALRPSRSLIVTPLAKTQVKDKDTGEEKDVDCLGFDPNMEGITQVTVMHHDWDGVSKRRELPEGQYGNKYSDDDVTLRLLELTLALAHEFDLQGIIVKRTVKKAPT